MWPLILTVLLRSLIEVSKAKWCRDMPVQLHHLEIIFSVMHVQPSAPLFGWDMGSMVGTCKKYDDMRERLRSQFTPMAVLDM